MNRLDFDAINSTLDAETLVPQWLPDGKRVGREWVARNPTRHDSNPGSFSVNLVSGAWADFATNDRGGDLISLYAYLFTSRDNGRAARELAERYGVNADAQPRRVVKLQQPEIVMPVPATAGVPSFRHPRFGHPSHVWEYRDQQGRLLLYVCRFDPPDLRKQIVPRSWVREPDGSERWAWRGISGDAKRPLYGLDRLAENPDADVIVCEGEKSADAAQRIVGERAVAVAWLGGVETAGKLSLRALHGRRVILWPDADAHVFKDNHPRAGELLPPHEQPGNRAMLAIADALRGKATSVLMVRHEPGEHPDGWDLADAEAEGWDADRLFAHVAECAVEPAAAVGPPAGPDGARVAIPIGQPLASWAFPMVTDKGQPLNTHENLGWMLEQYGIVCRYNEMRHSVDIEIPGREYSADNRANCALAEIASLCALNRMPRESLVEYARVIADRNRHHPVLDWITSKPWDGRSRLPDLYATVSGPGDAWLRERLILRWLLSAVAALVADRFTAHGVLVFQGDQGLGKTSWVKSLAPVELGAVLDGATIDPDNKDTVLTAISHWLVELGELDATFRKADVERLKAFITRPVDKVRRPYDRVDSEFRRRTVFFASVNADRYLVDDTGNRRWWTVPVDRIDYQHGIDMQQLWAEVLELHRQGHQHWLTADELAALNESNREHEAVDPVEELIAQHFDWSASYTQRPMTATEVLVAIGFDRPTKLQANHCAQVLRKLTGKPPRKSGSRRVFDLPPKRGELPADDDIPF